MPKETKKFINPLLRPSQTADTPPAQPPQPEIAEEPEEKPQRDVSATRAETQPESPQPSEVAQVGTTQAAPAPVRLSTRQTRSADKNDENSGSIAEKPTVTADTRRSSTARPLPSQEEPQSREPARSNQSVLEENVPSSTRIGSRVEPVTPPPGDKVLDEPYENYDLITFSEDHRAAARRRRNPQQPFEMTHERITLWMDKQLKQRFEALASQRELPKTALINEAVSALLEKYEAR